jgi:hypothetical protein
MRDASLCKGCGPQYDVTEERITRMLEAPMFQTDIAVADEVYEQRLALCWSCSRLMNGQTCTVCGCFVRVRAKFKDRGCPNPGEARW